MTEKQQFATPYAMARPKKSDAIGATEYVGARIPADLRAKLEVMAKEHKRSLSEEVRAAIERYAGIRSGKSATSR